MKRNILKTIILSVFVQAFLLVSCDRVGNGKEDVGGTSTQDMAGDWYVTTSVGKSVVLGYKKITTYNTSVNDGKEMWVDDLKNIWWFKVKSPINYSAKTFSGSKLHSSIEGYDVDVNITNGKIIPNAAKTSGGNKSDSISFDAEFSDDPGTIYHIGGYKRTGFAEDEH